jgi:CelD/BcsL family acetyltransferase involved in cellulose biosynthesis
LKTYSSLDDLALTQSEWDRCAEAAGCDISQTYDWCRIWWKYYGAARTLRIYEYRCGETLVAVIPLFFESLRLAPLPVKVGKIVASDCSNATICPIILKDYLPQVCKAFAHDVTSDADWDILHIGPVSGIYPHLDELVALIKQSLPPRFRANSVAGDMQTYFELAHSSGAQIRHFSAKQQRILRQKYRVLNEILGDDTPVRADFATETDLEQVFDRFYEAHTKHWLGSNRNGHFGDWPQSKQFHFEMARKQLKRGRLRFLTVKAGEYFLGFKYAYRFGERCLEFLDARLDTEQFERASLGKIIFAEQAAKAAAEGVRRIDSLTGVYPHKLRAGGKLLPTHNIYITRTSLPAKLKVRIFTLLCSLLHVLYYKLWFSRMAPKMPFERRPLRDFWIRTHMFNAFRPNGVHPAPPASRLSDLSSPRPKPDRDSTDK